MGQSNFLCRKLERAVFSQVWAAITSLTLKWYTTVPNAAGAGGVEYSPGAWTNYAPLTIDTGTTNFPSGGSDPVDNDVAFSFPEAVVTGGATVEIAGYAIFDQSGNQIFQAAYPLQVINKLDIIIPVAALNYTQS